MPEDRQAAYMSYFANNTNSERDVVLGLVRMRQNEQDLQKVVELSSRQVVREFDGGKQAKSFLRYVSFI
jgi:hypothetical protein